MKLAILSFGLIFLTACSSQKSGTQSGDPGITLWVNSATVDCVGVGPMKCLQVQQGEAIDEEQWKMFYSGIEGFEFEPGYRYKLLVKTDTLPQDQVPADASSIRYTLLEVMEKKPDTRLRLHDIWALTHLNGEAIKEPAEGMERPRLEIQVAGMKAMGTDGCNGFRGMVQTLTDSALVFGPLASTMMMCRDMSVADPFNQSMRAVRAYQLEGLELILMNEESEEMLRFRKVD